MLIVVNTNRDDDTVNADGGLMSLREAIRLADATPGADEIVFDPSAFVGGFNRIDMQRDSTLPTAAATTSNAFRITSGDGLTINGDFDGDGLADVEIFGGFLTINGVFSVTPHFEIAAGAVVTLEALELTGGGMAVLAPAQDGGAATGFNRSPAGADGRDAYGSILNEGTLTLDRVRINDTLAIAQDGGNGGQGGQGGAGPDGFDGVDVAFGARDGGNGFDGNEGANGGRGGHGGDAATILNFGSLTIRESAIGPNNSAIAGDGGDAGKGGRGGAGGDGGDGADARIGVGTSAGEGGDGGSAGRPGTGGRGGDGGDASAGVLNIGGSVVFETALASTSQSSPVEAGAAGAAGAAGDRGSFGVGGSGGQRLNGSFAPGGSAGGAPFGSTGLPGSPGAASDLVIGETAPQTAETLVFARALAEEATEGEEIAFAIGRIDAFFVGILDVEWRVFVGAGGISLDESDFAEGTEFSGSVRLSGANNGAVIRLQTVVDGVFEAPETVAFTIESARITGGDPLTTTGTVSTRLLSDFAADLAEDNDLTAEFDDGDTLEGGGGNDTLRGGPGGDLLLGGADNDLLLGGGGNDTLHGGPGVNRIEGGAGQDEAVFEGAFADYLIVRAEGGLRLSRAGETTTVLEAETFRFADGARSLAAITPADPPPTPPNPTPSEPLPPGTPSTGPTMGDDLLIGTPGPERIAAMGGDDTVRALGGNDTLLGQLGDDVLRGGLGDDVLRGGAGADTLAGQGGDDVLRGGGGDDALRGGPGADRLFGASGNDVMRGGGGNDFLKGGGGADTIMGNKGADTMTGGSGPDLFQFRPGDGNDVIRRFQQGQDKVEFLRGVEGFGDLIITQQGADALLRYTGGSILFETQNAGALAEDDFLF